MTLKVEQDEFVGDWVVISDIAANDGSDSHIIERFDTWQEAIIYASEHKMMGTKFEKLEQLIEAVSTEMNTLSDKAPQGERDELGFIEFPHEIRWKLHVLACSIRDYTFWAFKVKEGEEWYRVYEVETGVYAEGVSPRHALENYFSHVFPDVETLPHSGAENEATP